MKHLLERWAELAPGECEHIPRGPKGAERFRLWVPEFGDWNTVTIPMIEGNRAMVLYAVLMCCEKRGWEPSIERYESKVGWVYAVDIDGCETGKEVAEAALSAYVKALEAEK